MRGTRSCSPTGRSSPASRNAPTRGRSRSPPGRGIELRDAMPVADNALATLITAAADVGNAGNITLRTPAAVVLTNSRVRTKARDTGGDIIIDAFALKMNAS